MRRNEKRPSRPGIWGEARKEKRSGEQKETRRRPYRGDRSKQIDRGGEK